MGFALVVAPFVVIALGPAQGVVLAQLCGAAAACLVFARVFGRVEWRAFAQFTPPSIVGVLAGTAIISQIREDVAQIVVGVILLLALASSALVIRARTIERSAHGLGATGAATGLMAAMAGVGGTPLAVFAQLTRWPHASFAATIQPCLVTISVVTVVLRLAIEPGAWPVLGWSGWAAIAAAMATGLIAGDRLTARISAITAGRLTTSIAAAGAIAAIVRGVLG